MGYNECEALWLSLLRAMPEFDSNNTSRKDWKILNSGKSNYYAVLKKGEVVRERMAFSTDVAHRQTIIELWVRYREDGTDAIQMDDLTDAITNYVGSYRLGGDSVGTIQRAQIVEEREPQQTPANAPAWLFVELVGQMDDEEAITYAE